MSSVRTLVEEEYGGGQRDTSELTAFPSLDERNLPTARREPEETPPDLNTGSSCLGQAGRGNPSSSAVLIRRRQRQDETQTPIQEDALVCMQCLPAVVTAGIRSCGLNCGATFCDLHSHSRSTCGQVVLTCVDCVNTHPKQLLKSHPGVPLFHGEAQQNVGSVPRLVVGHFFYN
eukprot:2337594-Amphidinium_carterae.1